MNANELADKLENEVNIFDHPCASDAADMLRQQQAEIEALKAVLKEAINGMGHSHQAKFKEYLK